MPGARSVLQSGEGCFPLSGDSPVDPVWKGVPARPATQKGGEHTPRTSDDIGHRVADDVFNGSIKANSPRGEHAKPEVSTETARLPKPGTAQHAASAPGSQMPRVRIPRVEPPAMDTIAQRASEGRHRGRATSIRIDTGCGRWTLRGAVPHRWQ